ncbi:hypothetical protein GOP47_0018233 [Adiantum capillus-veneris]|uniref:Uncharacterized protein n=1 Tax=Adiantum capillus-veneris TaxID=13818 RepID=A0A9D4ZBN5_ADICA|nr:hypothetical protein GOP47_0018233 [Adiantum capillus-veneris]
MLQRTDEEGPGDGGRQLQASLRKQLLDKIVREGSSVDQFHRVKGGVFSEGDDMDISVAFLAAGDRSFGEEGGDGGVRKRGVERKEEVDLAELHEEIICEGERSRGRSRRRRRGEKVLRVAEEVVGVIGGELAYHDGSVELFDEAIAVHELDNAF